MHTAEMIHQAYEKTIQNTLDIWKAHPGTGVIRNAPFYHPSRLAITSGSRAGVQMSGLLSELRQIVQHDALADIAPDNGMHFSFFAITRALYDTPQEAEGLAELTAIFTEHCAGHVTHLRDLRLVALPDQLLLAGIPDEESLRVRQALVEHLLQTQWAEKIRARFPTGPVPQVFWHSTLLRYGAQYLPDSLRTYFQQHQDKNFGSVSLPVTLVMTNYNWTETFTLV